MARKNLKSYIKELREYCEMRTGREFDPFLFPQLEAAARTKQIVEKIHDEVINQSLTLMSEGSMGQTKQEVNPLLKAYKDSSTLLNQQLQALGLNYLSTPSKINESTKKESVEDDPLSKFLR